MQVRAVINEHLLAVLFDMNKDVSALLGGLSCVAHILLIIYRKNRTAFMPAQLYHDLQAFVRSAFFIVARAIELCPDLPFFMFQIGTDRLEQLFAFVRTVTHHRNCNTSELCDRFAAAYQLAGIWETNPTWRQPSRRLTGTKDHMNTLTWSKGPEGNTSVRGVSVLSCWMEGRRRAVEVLKKHSGYGNVSTSTFRSLADEGVTMFQPW